MAKDNTISNVLITEDMLPVYQAYAEAQEAIKEAEAKRDAAKAKIISFHKKNGAIRIKDKGFSSTLSEGHRETLRKDVIEEKFDIPYLCLFT